MAITKAKVMEMNSRLGNDWKFDLRSYVFHGGEKSIRMEIPQDEAHYIEAHLYFSDKVECFRKVGLDITLHIAHYTKHGDISASYGLGLFRTIPYSKSRRSYADLEKLSHTITPEYIMEIYNTGSNAEKCLDNILLDKTGWHVHEV